MTSINLTRRQWLVAMCALGLGKSMDVAAEDLLSKSVNTGSYSPKASEALARLMTGNQRFMDGLSRHAHEGASWRSLLVETQKPFATVLGCSDSRAPPELIFDVGFGDLFTIRLAGNVIDEAVFGTLNMPERTCTRRWWSYWATRVAVRSVQPWKRCSTSPQNSSTSKC